MARIRRVRFVSILILSLLVSPVAQAVDGVFKVVENGQPAADQQFTFEIGGDTVVSTSDEQGIVKVDVGDSSSITIDRGVGGSESTRIDLRAGYQQVIPAGDGLFGLGKVHWLGWKSWGVSAEIGAGYHSQSTKGFASFPGFGNPEERHSRISGAQMTYGLRAELPVSLCCTRPYAQFNYNQSVGDSVFTLPTSGTPGATGFTVASNDYRGSADITFGLKTPLPLDRVGIPYTTYVSPFVGIGFDRYKLSYGVNEVQFGFAFNPTVEDYVDTRYVVGGQLDFPLCSCGSFSSRLFARGTYRGAGDTIERVVLAGPGMNSPAHFRFENGGVTTYQAGVAVDVSPLHWLNF